MAGTEDNIKGLRPASLYLASFSDSFLLVYLPEQAKTYDRALQNNSKHALLNILDLFNHSPSFAKLGGFIARFKILICLTIELLLYRGGSSLQGTVGGNS